MKIISLSANIAWQIAAEEAENAQYAFIEPEHILIGICSLAKLVANKEVSLSKLRDSPRFS